MNPAYKIGLAAAAVLVIAIVGYNVLPRSGPIVGNTSPAPTSMPTPTISSTATPAGSPGPWVLFSGPLVAHEYFTRPLAPPNETMTFTFEIPDGWVGFAPWAALPASGNEGPTGMAFVFGIVERLYSNPCKAEDSSGSPVPGDVVLGPSVDDLAAAFQDQTAYEATAPVDAVLGGYSGKEMTLQLPSAFECPSDSFFPWEGSTYAQGPSDRWHIWILDVEGVRVVVLARDFAATPAEDRAELQAIMDSLQIMP